ncbi:MAG: leucyl aminopeptidase [Acidimicrobiia bacterium]
MIDIVAGDPAGADVLIIPVLVGRIVACEPDLAPHLDDVSSLLDARDFTGKNGESVFIQTPAGIAPEVLLVGLGEEIDAESLRRAAGHAVRRVSRYQTVATALNQVDIDGAANSVALGSWLGGYSYDEYKSDPKTAVLSRMTLASHDDLADQINEARVIATGVRLARDLVNRPARDKAPRTLAAVAQSLSDKIDVTVYQGDEISEQGFGGLEAVNLGSDEPAHMVVMRYSPIGATSTVAFVGKGIVFDSGGLSIKPAAGMESMKTDMAGAAAVLGAIQAIAALDLVVNVVGITPFTENMTGGSAQRPGDVLRAYNGKTIEVLNTDAEGRLVLADGLALAAEERPDLIVDIATLTGACNVALGPLIAGLFATDDDAARLVLDAAAAAGEKVWRLPLEQEYRSSIESDIADMKNTTGRYGGAIGAALLLSEFVGDIPWVHLDIAGPARAEKTEHYITKGASGFGVRALVSVARAMESDAT